MQTQLTGRTIAGLMGLKAAADAKRRAKMVRDNMMFANLKLNYEKAVNGSFCGGTNVY